MEQESAYHPYIWNIIHNDDFNYVRNKLGLDVIADINMMKPAKSHHMITGITAIYLVKYNQSKA